MSFSMHKYEPGFYPCSGSVDDVGSLRGKYYSVNCPLNEGFNDDQLIAVFKRYCDDGQNYSLIQIQTFKFESKKKLDHWHKENFLPSSQYFKIVFDFKICTI